MDGSLMRFTRLTSVIIFSVILREVGTAQQCVITSPPDDAIVLFEGTDAPQWVTMKGDPCPWTVEDGVMAAREQNIITKQEFGDHQLHVEFYVPVREDPNDKLSGNSGVYVHGDYEIQVIDSHGIEPDAGVSCGAIYGQAAPLVNASLPAGEWQSFDVYFHAPRFDGEGKLVKKARMSVLHNGIWIHDDRECDMTPGGLAGNLKTTGPLLLQYHGYPVRYRNIWVRPIRSAVARGREMTIALTGAVTMDLLHIPPGTFIMGAPENEPDREIDEAQHEVTLTREFWLGKLEVTNRQFRAFRPEHVSYGVAGEEGEFNGDDQPVVAVDLADVEAFCRWASEQTGLNVRLPTEAEWEYACRAGTTSTYCYGDERDVLGEYCWYSENSGWVTHPVGQKRPNSWGLYDMHGNVAEWVADWYTYYPGGPQTDPKGPPASGTHCWRECSWSSKAFECRCATRDHADPKYKSAALGFRVACDP